MQDRCVFVDLVRILVHIIAKRYQICNIRVMDSPVYLTPRGRERGVFLSLLRGKIPHIMGHTGTYRTGIIGRGIVLRTGQKEGESEDPPKWLICGG